MPRTEQEIAETLSKVVLACMAKPPLTPEAHELIGTEAIKLAAAFLASMDRNSHALERIAAALEEL